MENNDVDKDNLNGIRNLIEQNQNQIAPAAKINWVMEIFYVRN